MKPGTRIGAALLCALLFVLMLPVRGEAAGAIDMTKESSLNITYKDGSTALRGVKFDLYQVAKLTSAGGYALTGEFKGVPVSLKNLDSEKMQKLASTLDVYIGLRDIEPKATEIINAKGLATFSGLEPGLYLVSGRDFEKDGYTYTSKSFLVFLPTLDVEENQWIYDMSVVPKYKVTPPPDDDDDTVKRKVLKIWDDDGREAERPKKIKVHLLRNGRVYDTVTLSESNNWRYTWEELDDDYTWTVVEDVPEGYTVSIIREGITFVITNSKPDEDDDTVKRKVLKIWDDDGREAERPKKIKVHLLRDGEIYDTVTLSESNNWRYTWEELDDDYIWTVTEDVPAGYTVSIVQDGITFVITNSKPDEDDDTVERKVLKIWDDDGRETERPKEIKVHLLRNGEIYDTVTLSESNNWRYAWEELDDDDTWTVVEDVPAGYTMSLVQDGITFIITNSKPDEDDDTVERKVLKIWDDDGREAERPKEIKVHLLRNGEIYDTVTLNESNNWRYAWEELDDDDTWTVVEDVPAGYTMSLVQDGITFIITNSKPDEDDDTVERKVLKIWDDDGNEADRPKEIKVHLLRDGEIYETVLLSESNNWRYAWDELDDDYTWAVVEEVPAGYTMSLVQDGDTFIITNSKPPNEPPPPPPPPPPELPQTGQLWWPVPILAAVGMLLFLIGYIRNRGADDET